MIRTTAARPLRIGAATVGIAGALALAGCASATTSGTGTADGSTTEENTSATDAATSGSSDSSSATYTDGTYTAEGTYQTPESQQYQSQFIGGISDVVVGKDIDTLSVSRVAGSSLTSSGFNEAIDEIKSEAAA
jgi:hypothetical protein